MLSYLRARNLGILEDAAISPSEGFTVITGETGAGKTLLLGALRLLTGEKTDSKLVGPVGDEGAAEGMFTDANGEFGAGRIVPKEGRSRSHLEGNLVSAEALGERVAGLIEIVGQHDHLRLRNSQSVLALIDGSLNSKEAGARRDYQSKWDEYREAIADQRRLGGDQMALERELDLVRYQASEISEAGLAAGDDAEMEQLANRLKNAEAIRENLGESVNLLESAIDGLSDVVSRLRRLETVQADFGESATVAATAADLASELARELRDAGERAHDDPQMLADLESRLNRLGDLKRKYGKTLDEVLEFGDEAVRRVGELETLLSKASQIEGLVARTRHGVDTAADRLTEVRKTAAGRVESKAAAHLEDLGLENAMIHFELERTEPGPVGADQASLLFTSDLRLTPRPVSEVASGGELSRLILALRLATRSKETDSLVFDEVDAGVGGATALSLGRKLADLATTTQVLCVTHLPQVAALADRHYVVERSGTMAQVRLVEGEERVTELTRMLSGLPESVGGREAAAELLEAAAS